MNSKFKQKCQIDAAQGGVVANEKPGHTKGMASLNSPKEE
jgi:hypothetical protein